MNNGGLTTFYSQVKSFLFQTKKDGNIYICIYILLMELGATEVIEIHHKDVYLQAEFYKYTVHLFIA